jgi:hypothetical protein
MQFKVAYVDFLVMIVCLLQREDAHTTIKYIRYQIFSTRPSQIEAMESFTAI